MSYVVKDSGVRLKFESGMQRDTTADKTNWSLIADGPMLKRWAEHLTKGAAKYTDRNWMLAAGEAELLRFRESAFRHFMQWYLGATDEDHASAVFFNINGAEYVKQRLSSSEADPHCGPGSADSPRENMDEHLDVWEGVPGRLAGRR